MQLPIEQGIFVHWSRVCGYEEVRKVPKLQPVQVKVAAQLALHEVE